MAKLLVVENPKVVRLSIYWNSLIEKVIFFIQNELCFPNIACFPICCISHLKSELGSLERSK